MGEVEILFVLQESSPSATVGFTRLHWRLFYVQGIDAFGANAWMLLGGPNRAWAGTFCR